MKQVKFKPGMLVFSIQYGWVILKCSPDIDYPLTVGSGYRTYNNNGFNYNKDAFRSLLTKDEALSLGIDPPPQELVEKHQAQCEHFWTDYGRLCVKCDLEINTPKKKTKTMKLEAWVDVYTGVLSWKKEGWWEEEKLSIHRRVPSEDKTVEYEDDGR